jgi:hypothetical protein
MTPKEKPPILLSASFQSKLLIFIAGSIISIGIKIFAFSNDLSKTIENHTNRIDFLEGRTKNLEVWRDMVVNKEYELRQGRNQTQIP